MQAQNLSSRILLIILDGFGINSESPKNAIKDANTANLDDLFKNYPFMTIEAGGESVGLPPGVAGNSEVGHMNLGAGRPVRQDLVRINESIEKGTFSELQPLKDLAENSKDRIHLMGLVSDGGVHSHIDHIKAIIKALSNSNHEIILHGFTDGRDTPAKVAANYIKELQDEFPQLKIGSLGGRSLGMDRDRRWEKIQLHLETMRGLKKITSSSPLSYIQEEYEQSRTDEFIEPVLFNEEYKIQDGDGVFFFNFRPDRAIQIGLALNDPHFKEFSQPLKIGHFLGMTPAFQEIVEVPLLFDKEKVTGGISEYLSQKGLKQFKIAETEKYAHVTYFFNGGEKGPFPNEEHFLVPSPKEISTYDQKPEMSAHEVTNKLLEKLEDQDISFFVVNFANSDMVGHTGNYQAAVQAIETLDSCVQKLIDKCREQDMALLLTSDHGNSDQMEYEDGSIHTSHTKAPVPVVLYHPQLKNQTLKTQEGALKDIAPTLLHIMGIPFPPSFTGRELFK